MDIMGMIVNLVGGAIGGNLSGAALKEKSLGMLGNTVAGAVGGAIGGYITQAVGLLTTLGLADMPIGSMVGEGGIAAVCGAVLTAVVGFIKSKMAK